MSDRTSTTRGFAQATRSVRQNIRSGLPGACAVAILTAACVALAASAVVAAESAEPVVRPLPEHPGNVFIAGEQVVAPLPAGTSETWQLTDYEGAVVAEGKSSDGRAVAGKLPVGYYELRRRGEQSRTSIAVLAPLLAPTPPTSPIGMDVAMAWFYKPDRMAAVANLCRLAGVNWVRDRLNWQEMEPEKGRFAPPNKYDDSAQAQAATGLRVLQVNHICAGWAGPDRRRFPSDLRDAWAFYREMARRWKGQVLAFEPWNEADIPQFGGHTGAEMASFQKASYLGLKAGNPEIIACLNVLAVNRAATLEDLDANECWPYFDTCNLHHYIDIEQYPAWYESFRRMCAGRPLWVTEFARPVQWSGDEKAQEPSDADLRVQAERVPMVFAASLHEGPQTAMYFILPHYVEGKTQFGIIRRDLTPRPAYVAMAAVGRLLADASPLGKLKTDAPLRAYVFSARPDGVRRCVMVTWSSGAATTLDLPVRPLAMADHLGRPMKLPDGALRVGREPVYLIFAADAAGKLATVAPPAMPPMKKLEPSTIVLQAHWPQKQTVVNRSAYRISSREAQSIPLRVYNFSDRKAAGVLRVAGPQAWRLSLPGGPLEIEPHGRRDVALEIDCRQTVASLIETVRITGDFGTEGRPVLSLRFQAEPLTVPQTRQAVIEGADDPGRWRADASAGSRTSLRRTGDGGIRCEVRFGPGDRWVYPRLTLGPRQRAPAGSTAVQVEIAAGPQPAQYRMILVEDNGAAYVCEPLEQPAPGHTALLTFIISEARFGTGWSPADPDGRLDIEGIRAIGVGCNTKADSAEFEFGNLRWVQW